MSVLLERETAVLLIAMLLQDIYAQIQAQFSYTLKLASRKRMEKLTSGRRESALYQKLVSLAWIKDMKPFGC